MYLIENRLKRNDKWCVVGNYNYMCHISAKDLQIRTLIKQKLIEYQFSRNYLKFHILTKKSQL